MLPVILGARLSSSRRPRQVEVKSVPAQDYVNFVTDSPGAGGYRRLPHHL